MNAEKLKPIIDKHQKWLRCETEGERADLRSTDLRSTDLSYANLSSADLRYANLSSADLRYANLSSADLRYANLRYANLRYANLKEIKLEQAWMPHGEKWETYLKEVVPALLVAGGKPINAIIESKAWQCHEWTNCPMAIAFGIQKESEAPLLLMPRVREFVQLFDAGLIPEPTI